MKIGFVSMPFSGHLNPMTALARKLQSRGHEVVFIGVPDIGPIVDAAGLTFIPYCEKEYPLGSIAKLTAPVSKLHGLEVMQYTIQNITAGLTSAALQHLPGKLAETGVQALVIDTVHRFVELVPMSLGMPYAHIWNILHMDGSGLTPPYLFSWPHEVSPEALTRNIDGLKKVSTLIAPVLEIAKSYAEKVGLQIDWQDRTATASRLAIITQTPREFDFPDSPWPNHFHYAGPFHDDDGREPIPFPWERLTEKPLVYASLGTLVNGLDHVYKTIVESVAKLPSVQLVLSIGTSIDPANLGPIPSSTIVVRSAPQIELLKRASLCITHAGLNTTLEALTQGVPMVAIPISYDQPGVAARIAHHGAGEFVDLEDLTVEHLSELIQRVITYPSYRDKARAFKKVIAQTRGLDRAADVIDRAFRKPKAARSVGRPSLSAARRRANSR
jgi:zeaxanthin glucosyltransferase